MVRECRDRRYVPRIRKRTAKPGKALKKELRHRLKAISEAHPDKRIELRFQGEARVGNKGRVCHRWWHRGKRPRGPRQIGYQWTCIHAAVRPASGDNFALVLPHANTAAMTVFLDRFAETRPSAHAVMVVDGAGWHKSRTLEIPDNITLVVLPSCCPELNPVERIWLYIRERFLSLRILDDTHAIVEACCVAWNSLVAEPGRIKSLCEYP